MANYFDCKFSGMKGLSQFDIKDGLSTPGERLIAKKLNELKHENIYIFKEYNISKGKRIDYLLYFPNACFVILEIKDWGIPYIEKIDYVGNNDYLMEFYKLKFIFSKNETSPKNPYETQAKRYLLELNKLFEKNKSLKYISIPVYSFIIFTNLEKKNFTEMISNSQVCEMISKYTFFKEEIEEFNIMKKISSVTPDILSRKDLRYRANYFIDSLKCSSDINTNFNILSQYNSVNEEMLLDNKQFLIAQNIENIDKRFLFLFGVVGSGKTLILERRLDLFVLELLDHKRKMEYDKNLKNIEDKILVFFKDSNSFLFERLKNKYKDYLENIIFLDFLTKNFYQKIVDDIILYNNDEKIEKILYFNTIKEIYIEEAHEILVNSKSSLDALKDFFLKIYYSPEQIKIICLLDSNQMKYDREYHNNFKKQILKYSILEVLGLNREEVYIEELNISYRLLPRVGTFSFRYLVHFMNRKNKLEFLEQVYSPSDSLYSIEDRSFYLVLSTQEIYNEVKEALNQNYSKNIDLRYGRNLIFLNSGRFTGMDKNIFDKNNNVQYIKTYDDIKKYDTNKKITVCENVNFIKGMEYENVILISKISDFFPSTEDTDYFEIINRNYIVLTRSLGNSVIILVNEYGSKEEADKIFDIINNTSNSLWDLKRNS